MKKLVVILALCVAAQAFSAWQENIQNMRREALLMQRQFDEEFYEDRMEAWAIVEKEALEGRPYIPYASRPEDLPQAAIPAFPGAEGGGAYTPGGRGGKVLVVTNLNDHGDGSLRWACEQGGARIVVFNVAGIIRLSSPVKIMAPYITIAGQSAPGDGVCIAGATVEINTHDVIIRHLRFRRGNLNPFLRDDALGGQPIGNVIIDHCSASWGLDENLSLYKHNYNGRILPTVNLTIQNCISSEGLDTYGQGCGSTIGGRNCTFIRNLWACNIGRNPSVGYGDDFNLINCVIFNWWNRTMDGGDNMSSWNVIGNYFKPGPATDMNQASAYRIAQPSNGSGFHRSQIFGRIYAEGNYMYGNKAVTKDNWNGGIQPEGRPDHELMAAVRVDEPFPMTYPLKKILPAKRAYRKVLRNSGATFPCRDKVDARVVRFVRKGKAEYVEGDYQLPAFARRSLDMDSYKLGIIYDPAQVGGYPSYRGEPYTDTDHDGMPDAWEKRYNLDPKDPSDAMKDCNGDGYANIEKFLNGINPRRKVDWTREENNRDPLLRRHRPLYGTNR